MDCSLHCSSLLHIFATSPLPRYQLHRALLSFRSALHQRCRLQVSSSALPRTSQRSPCPTAWDLQCQGPLQRNTVSTDHSRSDRPGPWQSSAQSSPLKASQQHDSQGSAPRIAHRAAQGPTHRPRQSCSRTPIPSRHLHPSASLLETALLPLATLCVIAMMSVQNLWTEIGGSNKLHTALEAQTRVLDIWSAWALCSRAAQPVVPFCQRNNC
mmetsp:Transcript_45634/g.83567  ORF Transcript_45634/g.83567 Transcript_45634/m.83567 type:complete len:212 (+) Transcript_45634:421-1056(+)